MVVDTTRISKVMPEINALVYYGYPVQELAEQCSFEEVAWLIWHGELPNAKQLAEFQAEERSERELSADLLAVLQRCPKRAHPMDVLRTGVSFLGMEDVEPEKQDAATNLKRSVSLLAKDPDDGRGVLPAAQGTGSHRAATRPGLLGKLFPHEFSAACRRRKS